MSQGSRVIEVSGSDVEIAIARGLHQLGVGRDKVSIDVLDEGSRGLLGLGRRDALVRLRLIELSPVVPMPVVPEEVPALSPLPIPPTPPIQPVIPEPTIDPLQILAELEQKPTVEDQVASESDQFDQEGQAAIEVWQILLSKLHLEAVVSYHLSEKDDLTQQQLPIIDLHGRDLSNLIGTHGETLDAMQYITRLIVSHQIKRRANFVVDVEGYRERRTQALIRLAERMAEKAVQRGQTVTLEPMPPNERRVIHIALRNHASIYTESTGEGFERRIRILLKNKAERIKN